MLNRIILIGFSLCLSFVASATEPYQLPKSLVYLRDIQGPIQTLTFEGDLDLSKFIEPESCKSKTNTFCGHPSKYIGNPLYLVASGEKYKLEEGVFSRSEGETVGGKSVYRMLIFRHTKLRSQVVTFQHDTHTDDAAANSHFYFITTTSGGNIRVDPRYR